MKKIPIPTIVTAVLLVGVFLLYMVSFVNRFSEARVVARWGKVTEDSVIRDAGLHFRWPLPIDTVSKGYDLRYRVLDTTEGEIKTFDGKNVIVGSYVIWQIEDPRIFHLAAQGREDLVLNDIKSRLNQARAAEFGRRELSDFVNLDPARVDKTYTEAAEHILAEAGPGIRQVYGVKLIRFGIRRISLPEQVATKVFDSMSAERQALAATYRGEGRARADTIRSQAESDANAIREFAKRRAVEIQSAGTSAATRLLSQIESEDAEFFIWLRWLDALKEALATKTTIFIDADSPLYAPFTRPDARPPATLSPGGAGAAQPQ